jgi:hypothetical protein
LIVCLSALIYAWIISLFTEAKTPLVRKYLNSKFDFLRFSSIIMNLIKKVYL